MTHLLKLLDKMYKYKMDLTSIVEDTILSTDGQTDRRTDRRTDKVKPVYPPFNFVEAEGIMKSIIIIILNSALHGTAFSTLITQIKPSPLSCWIHLRKKYIFYIFYHFSKIIWCRYLKFILVDDTHPFIVHRQCLDSGLFGEARSMGIGRHGIDPVHP